MLKHASRSLRIALEPIGGKIKVTDDIVMIPMEQSEQPIANVSASVTRMNHAANE